MIKLTADVTLTQHRCFECGRHWAFEDYGAGLLACPRCARAKVEAAEARASVAERSARAYKAAAKRARGKR